MSTGIGLGIGIPHIRYSGVKQPLVAVGISSGLSDYESIDGFCVQIILLVVVGEGQHRQHISLLSQFMKILKDAETRKELIDCETTEFMFKI